jgi:predicted AlkP superfamily phosphohydrolase/phosphomutase
MPDKVCVIGLDCVPPELALERWRDDLPNIKRLMESGIHGPLESTIPPITVPAWMSMMTGIDPGTLGVYGFRNRKDHSYDGLTFANSRMVNEEAVWDILAKHGKRSILLGVPLTYPPRPIHGHMVCDFLAPDTSVEYTYPPDLKDEIEEVVGDYIIDVRDFRTDQKDRLLEQIYTMTERRFQLARHLLTTKEWDFFIMVEMGTDRIHHGFWRYFDPDHPLFEPGNPYENAIHDYYVYCDILIGQTLETLPSDTMVLVVSDHGAKRMDGGICFNEWLMREGYLALKETPGSVTKFSPSMVDWNRTKAWADGGYYGRLFLNVQGREPCGIVPADEYEAVRCEISRKLEALGDEDGQPIGTKVFRPQDVYDACNNVAPDLIVYFGDLNWRSVGSVGHGTVWIHENDTGPDDANHAQFGMAVISTVDGGRWTADRGKGRRGEEEKGRAGQDHGSGVMDHTPPIGQRDGMSIYDIAPTILRAFGIEPPAGMGRSALISTESPSVYSAEEEAEIARRLEDLGYL